MPSRTGFCSRLILTTVFYVYCLGEDRSLITKGMENRQKERRQLLLEVQGGSRAPDRQLHGQAWFGPINAIVVPSRKGTGTYGSKQASGSV